MNHRWRLLLVLLLIALPFLSLVVQYEEGAVNLEIQDSGSPEPQQPAAAAALQKQPADSPLQPGPHSRTARLGPEDLPKVQIGIMTGHFLGAGFLGRAPNCKIECYVSMQQSKAHLLIYHGPGMSRGRAAAIQELKRLGYQRTGLFSMEPDVYYPAQRDPVVREAFDLTMTYHVNDDVPMIYFPPFWPGGRDLAAEESIMRYVHLLQMPPIPFHEKKSAVVYLNGNCGAKSGRDRIVGQLMERGKVPVESWGRCLNNMQNIGRVKNKTELFSRYKFCITIENSVSLDYFSEKTLDGLLSGCLPIVYGPSNIRDVLLPAPNAAVDMSDPTINGDIAKLEERLLHLLHNESAYNETMAWRWKPFVELAPGFKRLASISSNGDTRCRACLLYRNGIFPTLSREEQQQAVNSTIERQERQADAPSSQQERRQAWLQRREQRQQQQKKQQQQQQQQQHEEAEPAAPQEAIQVAFKQPNGSRAQLKPEDLPRVHIGILTGHFLGAGFLGRAPHCKIECYVSSRPAEAADKAHLVIFHGPGMSKARAMSLLKMRQHLGYQRTGLFSMEPDMYYSAQRDPEVRAAFDLTMTYHVDDDVPMIYFPPFWPGDRSLPAQESIMQYVNLLQMPPIPFHEKKSAVVYLNGNCGARSGRDRIVGQLMERGKVPVESWGRCLNNMQNIGRVKNKTELFSRYKFCITIENSVSLDYFSEKTLDGLLSGCLPIVYGPSNIRDVLLPAPNAAVDISDPTINGDIAKLEERLLHLLNNESAYNETMAWRWKPFDELAPGFQRLTSISSNGDMRCRACLLYRNEVFPKLSREDQQQAVEIATRE